MATTRRTRRFVVTDPHQMEALSLPIRTEIVEMVAYLGPCSIRELAEMLGRKAPALTYHVRFLEERGLLLEAGTRGEGRNREVVYQVPGQPFLVGLDDPSDTRKVDLIGRYTRNMLRRAERALLRALPRGRRGLWRNGPAPFMLRQHTCWVDEEKLARIHEHVAAIAELTQPSPPQEGDHLFLVTVTISSLDTPQRAPSGG